MRRERDLNQQIGDRLRFYLEASEGRLLHKTDDGFQ